MPRLAADTLRRFVAECYRAMGVPGPAAELVADTLVQADLWGHPSHGVMRTFWYARRLRSGAMDGTAAPRVVTDAGALALVDGQDGLGQVTAAFAMDEAIARAKAHGIGAVAARHSGHFGTAMYYTRRATLAGCIGFLSTNASPAMAPWGGAGKRVGTNPWSWAAPAGRYPPMMLDIANTAVARGKLYAARARGEAIPEGWAVGPDGAATADPAAGIAGTILPMAGHKGYAIATLVDVLSGVLSGSAFGDGVVGPYVETGRSGAGHLAMAIDIACLRAMSDFEADMERLVEALKATPRQPGVDEIFYPGEPEARSDTRLRAQGIELPASIAAELAEGAASLGIAFPG